MRWYKKSIGLLYIMVFACSFAQTSQNIDDIWLHCTILKVNSISAKPESIIFLGLLAFGQYELFELNSTENIELKLEDTQATMNVNLNSGTYSQIFAYNEYATVDAAGQYDYQANCTRLPGSKIAIGIEQGVSSYRAKTNLEGEDSEDKNLPKEPRKFKIEND